MESVGYIVLLYNDAEHLEDVIKGLSSQTGTFQREFIFIDYGSKDKTLEILKTSTLGWENISIITCSKENVSPTFNSSINQLKTDYVKPLDGKTILPPYTTQLLLDGLDKYPAASLAYGNQDYYKEFYPLPQIWHLQKNPILSSCKKKQVPLSTWLAKTSLIKDMGGCDSSLSTPEYSLELRLSLRGPFAHVKKTVSIYKPSIENKHPRTNSTTSYELNLALTNICKENKLPKSFLKKFYNTVAHRSLVWSWKNHKLCIFKPLYKYIRSFLTPYPSWRDIQSTCFVLKKYCSISYDDNKNAKH